MTSLCYAYGDSTCINTGEVKLVKNKKVSTSFINTCCALGFSVDGYNFLAHIDEITSDMYDKTINELNIIKDKFNKIHTIKIWIGAACNIDSCGSFDIVQQVLNYMNIDKNKIKYYKDNNDTIIIG
jgi:hypothetical protein